MNGKTATDSIALQEELLTGLVSASYVSKQAKVREVDLVIGVPPESTGKYWSVRTVRVYATADMPSATSMN